MPQLVSKPLSELEISHNIQHKGGIYTVTNTLVHEDDTTVTVKVGYPRVLDHDTFELVTEITDHGARRIPVYERF